MMIPRYLFMLLILPFVGLLAACLPEVGMESSPQTIEVTQPYAFATVPGARTAAAFMTIENTGADADQLVAAESPVAGITEIHENRIDPEDGTMMMRKIEALDLAPGRPVALEPQGHHIMFIDLQESLGMGQQFDLTLMFASGKTVKTKVDVVAPGKIPHQ